MRQAYQHTILRHSVRNCVWEARSLESTENLGHRLAGETSRFYIFNFLYGIIFVLKVIRNICRIVEHVNICKKINGNILMPHKYVVVPMFLSKIFSITLKSKCINFFSGS